MSNLWGQFRIKFWGTRGSIPVSSLETLKYGGNTACVEVRCGDNLIIIDSGTGIRNLGNELLKEMPIKASILFSHVHWDHIQGMPFFQPVYEAGNEFKLYGSKNWDEKLEYVLKEQMRPPRFPVTLEDVDTFGAKIEYINIDPGTVFKIGGKAHINITTAELYHPNISSNSMYSTGFRIEYGGKIFVYATDTESLPKPDERLLELAYGADLLIHDAQYTSHEYYGLNGNSKKKFGHSTPEAAAEVALNAKVKKLVLFHHDPNHDDATVEQMLQAASAIFPNTVVASEGMIIDLSKITIELDECCSMEKKIQPIRSSGVATNKITREISMWSDNTIVEK